MQIQVYETPDRSKAVRVQSVLNEVTIERERAAISTGANGSHVVYFICSSIDRFKSACGEAYLEFPDDLLRSEFCSNVKPILEALEERASTALIHCPVRATGKQIVTQLGVLCAQCPSAEEASAIADLLNIGCAAVQQYRKLE